MNHYQDFVFPQVIDELQRKKPEENTLLLNRLKTQILLKRH